MPSETTPTVADLVSQALKDSSQQTAGGSKEASGSHASGEMQLPEYMKGELTQEEFAALPKDAQQHLLTYGKTLYSGFQRKTELLAREREQLEELKGKMEQTLKEAVTHKDASITTAQASAKSFFDELLEQSPDAASRETLLKLRRGILQETKADEVWKKLEGIEQALGKFLQTTQVSRQQQVEHDLTQLTPAFHPLVEKYRKDLLTMSVQYPNLSTRRLLQLVSTEDEYDQAVQGDAARQVKKELQRTKEGASGKPQATVGTIGLTDKDFVKPKNQIFGKRVNWKAVLPNVVAEVRRETPS